MLLVLIVATWKEMSGNALPLFRGCWVAPCKPISLAVTQPQRWKKNLKMGPELMTLDRGSYMSEIKTPGATPHCVRQMASRTWQLSSLPVGRVGEGVTRYRGNWHQIGCQLPGKPVEKHAPHCPFDKLSNWRCCDLKIRTVTIWGLGASM